MLWRVNELVQRPASVPRDARPRFIAVPVIQLAFALIHWIAYAVVVGTHRPDEHPSLSPHASPARPISAVAPGSPSLAHVEEDSDTDEEDLIDPRLSRRASVASQAYVRARTVSMPAGLRHSAYGPSSAGARQSAYGTLSSRPRVSAPPPSA